MIALYLISVCIIPDQMTNKKFPNCPVIDGVCYTIGAGFGKLFKIKEGDEVLKTVQFCVGVSRRSCVNMETLEKAYHVASLTTSFTS
jgi:hypothetical protein